jgi:hypothetical protein
VHSLERRPSAIFGTSFAKGDFSPAAKNNGTSFDPRLRRIEFRIGVKRTVDFKRCLKLRGGRIGFQVVSFSFGVNLPKLKK